MSDIEQRLREAEERLAMEIAVEMELHAAISTTTKAKAEAIAKFLAPAFASLRSKLEEAEGALERLAKKIAACNWYWPEDDTSSEACFESAQEVLDSAYIKRGEVLAVARGGVVEVTYCASLPPADDADSDDEFWVEEKTYEAAALKVAEEQSRRTLSSLREADHA